MNIEVKIYNKTATTKIAVLNGVEFEYNNLVLALRQLISTKENASNGTFSINKYCLDCDYDTIAKLVDLGLARCYIFKQEEFYCIAAKDTVIPLLFGQLQGLQEVI